MKTMCEACKERHVYRHGLCAKCTKAGVRRPQMVREQRLRETYDRAIQAYVDASAEDDVAFDRAWDRLKKAGARYHAAQKLNDPRRRKRSRPDSHQTH
jgi:hypothetical protein